MSLHNKPEFNTPALIAALKEAGLNHDKPSQLADGFRVGWFAALAEREADGWRTDMENAPKDQRILIGYWFEPSDGGQPTFVWQPAFYIEAFTYPIGEYGNVDDGDYDEDRDEIFVKAGWYSDPTIDEGGVRIGFEPTHYNLIPLPPAKETE